MPNSEQENHEPAEDQINLTPEQEKRVAALRQILDNPLDAKAFESAVNELYAIHHPEEKKERGELSPEIIASNQRMYDFFNLRNPDGSKINLEKEYREGKILLPTPEQREIARREGYTQEIIIDDRQTREAVEETVKASLAREFSSQGIYLTDQAQQDKNKTIEADPPKPSQSSRQFYLLLLKPEPEVKDAHPETMNQDVNQCLAILKQKNQENLHLNLQGLSWPEYLYFQTYFYLQEKERGHIPNPQTTVCLLESKTWSWLLKETVKENNKLARCLDALFGPGDRQVYLNSLEVEHHLESWGARFAAVPVQPSPL